MYQYSLLRKLTPTDEQAITQFLLTCPGFHYFQSPVFFNVCRSSERSEPFYVIARQENEIVGVLLAYRQLQLGLPVVRFLSSRNLIIGGPVVAHNNAVITQGLLDAYRTYGLKSLYTQVRNFQDTNSVQSVFEEAGFRYDDHLNILVDLTYPQDELWKQVHTKRRNEIRRAEKEGCTVVLNKNPEALTECYAILTEVYQRAKLPLPNYSHFDAIWQHSTDQIGLRLFTAMWEGQIIGCVLCLACGDTLYDYYAGAYSRYYSKYPNDLLPWAVFMWGKENGFSWFDFGGAGKPDVPYGVRDYKKKFGGSFINHGRYEKNHYPALLAVANKLFTLWRAVKR
ncbi:lipid II:glycine glycyltransferase FemX [Spirosoma oryzicola]|uniref:lipid II:glycine glycyltransferase FemX n=1 Tax=Spirosoma oryzicola TaxID=2898794 RepID=UPI001E4F5C5D|nr:GNAT family N-acetyltransferase [Spirosoma oryzicola]UHG94024.1 GNAT family N-acetyltransferase [Spirosoma oryzicola]